VEDVSIITRNTTFNLSFLLTTLTLFLSLYLPIAGPPTAALPLVCSDEGNATLRHARPTLHHVPCSAELLAQTRQPLAVAFTPMAPPEEVT